MTSRPSSATRRPQKSMRVNTPQARRSIRPSRLFLAQWRVVLESHRVVIRLAIIGSQKYFRPIRPIKPGLINRLFTTDERLFVGRATCLLAECFFLKKPCVLAHIRKNARKLSRGRWCVECSACSRTPSAGALACRFFARREPVRRLRCTARRRRPKRRSRPGTP